MEAPIIRIQQIEIENLKNVSWGRINMSKYGKRRFYDGESSVIGLYGQNGSGKTVAIEAFSIVRTMLLGEALPKNFARCIRNGESCASIKVCFYIEEPGVQCLADYQFVWERDGEEKTALKSERLSASVGKDGQWKPRRDLFYCERAEGGLSFAPKYRFEQYAKRPGAGDLLERAAGRALGWNGTGCETGSCLFSGSMQKLLGTEADEELAQLTETLKNYAAEKFTVQKSGCGFAMTVPFSDSNVSLDLYGVNMLPQAQAKALTEAVKALDTVMQSLVPGIGLRLHTVSSGGKESEGMRECRLETVREGSPIPMAQESAGICKMITLILMFAACYHDPSCCAVIDELDCGIYEYLLGELLVLMKNDAKGQLFFTSHNLRPLEVLENDSLTFTTANPKNRYLRPFSVKNTRNTRLCYLRAVVLGGKQETLYEETSLYEISAALRRIRRDFDGTES